MVIKCDICGNKIKTTCDNCKESKKLEEFNRLIKLEIFYKSIGLDFNYKLALLSDGLRGLHELNKRNERIMENI